jgi:hypothetical protein
MRALAIVACIAAGTAFADAGHGQATGTRLPSLLERAGTSLVEADGTLSWRALATITNVRHENADGRYGYGVAYFLEPVLPEAVRALDGKTVRVRGYMLPRLSEDGNARFQVSALPAADDDGCAAGATENLVDVVARGSVDAKVDRLVTVEGTLTFFDAKQWSGYVYRLADARIVDAR